MQSAGEGAHLVGAAGLQGCKEWLWVRSVCVRSVWLLVMLVKQARQSAGEREVREGVGTDRGLGCMGFVKEGVLHACKKWGV